MYMNLHFAFFFALLVTEFDALCVQKIASFRGRGIATRKLDLPMALSLLKEKDSFANEEKFPTDHPYSIQASSKKIVLIRHGRTYMNEYIGGGGVSFGQPNFTDVFSEEEQKKYHDSPLSDVGVEQAKSLNYLLRDLKHNKASDPDALGMVRKLGAPRHENISTFTDTDFLHDLDLVVVSPLTRALETFEMSLKEHIDSREDDQPGVRVLAMAAAAERLYLVSDLGKPRSELRLRHPSIDFDTAFAYSHNCGIQSSCDAKDSLDAWHFQVSDSIADCYEEWRPNGQGQVYACFGEPSEYFDRRMTDFYYWLESRKENCIAIVCHAGVIDWLTSGEKFSNCELRVQPFDRLRPRALREKRPLAN